MAGVLNVSVVLIGPEPGDIVVRDTLAQHVSGGVVALPHRVLPVLDSNMAAEYRVKVIGDVTGRIDAVNTRRAILIDGNTVVDSDLSAVQQIDHGLHTNADDGEIARDAETGLGDDTRRPSSR